MASFGVEIISSRTKQIFRVSLFKSTQGSIKQSTCGLGKTIQALGLVYLSAGTSRLSTRKVTKELRLFTANPLSFLLLAPVHQDQWSTFKKVAGIDIVD